MAERRRWDPNWLVGYTWSTWLAPAYQSSSDPHPLLDPPARREPGRDDECEDTEESGAEETGEVT